MAQLGTTQDHKDSALTRLIAWLGRLFVAVIIPLLAFLVIYFGFIFLRDTKADRWVMATVAIVWGVGGVALLYWVFNGIVERMADQWKQAPDAICLCRTRTGNFVLVSGFSGCTHFLVEPVRP